MTTARDEAIHALAKGVAQATIERVHELRRLGHPESQVWANRQKIAAEMADVTLSCADEDPESEVHALRVTGPVTQDPAENITRIITDPSASAPADREPVAWLNDKARQARCRTCGEPATCLGSYEMHPPAFSCDTCCGHGNEDGWCYTMQEIVDHGDEVRAAIDRHLFAGTPPEQAEAEKLRRIIELERTVAARTIHGVEAALSSFSWLTEGRGSYEWDDDRWHDELRNACEKIGERLYPLRRVAQDLTNIPESVEGRASAVAAYVNQQEPDEGEDVPTWVHRALMYVSRALESPTGNEAVKRETGGTAPELVQGLLDQIDALHRRPDPSAPLLEALKEIADPDTGWRFKVDPLEHARSVVEEMREKARAAIERHEAEPSSLLDDLKRADAELFALQRRAYATDGLDPKVVSYVEKGSGKINSALDLYRDMLRRAERHEGGEHGD